MPEPDDKQLEDYLEDKSEISRLYKESPMESSSPALDERIMLAARQELRPRFQRWMLPLSAAAVTLFAVSIMLRMQHENISPLPQEKTVGAPAVLPPASDAAQIPPAKKEQAPAPASAEEMKSRMRRDEAPVLNDAAPQPLPSAGAAPAAPVPQGELQEQDQSLYNAAPSESEEGGSESVESAPAPAAEARQKSAVEAGSTSAAKPAENPEAWIQRIRQLRADGKSAEASAEIRKFRARYPDYQLPDDLKWAD